MSEPIVLILSIDDTVKPETVVEKIRKEPNDQNQVTLTDPQGTVGYRYHIHTKYYDTDVILYAHGSGVPASVPSAILKRMEGILIYFNAKDRSFLERLPEYGKFVQQNEIEFGILLCTFLYENSTDGVTYGEAKKLCTVLDVIELEPIPEDGEEDAATEGEAVGVDELVQAMHNHIWSNVNIHRGTRVPEVDPTEDELPVPPALALAPEPAATNPTNEDRPVTEEEEQMIEAELSGFERLLREVMNFQPNTNSWSRNERLMYAQELAELFDNMVEEED